MSENRVAGEDLTVEARGLVKVYGETRALDGIDLTVRRGQVFGFLGPNGAGKTTTIRILATLARPDGGTARVLGCDVASEADAIQARVTVTGQFASLDDDLSGYENLIVLGRLRGLSRATSKQRADELLAAFDLTSSASRPVRGYSGGMRRGPGTDEQHERRWRPGRLVPHRDRRHHPRVRAARPPPLQQPRVTNAGCHHPPTPRSGTTSMEEAMNPAPATIAIPGYGR